MYSAINLSNAIEVLFSHSYSIVRPFEVHFLIFIAPLFPTLLTNILARLCYFAISNFPSHHLPNHRVRIPSFAILFLFSFGSPLTACQLPLSIRRATSQPHKGRDGRECQIMCKSLLYFSTRDFHCSNYSSEDSR